MLKRIYQMSLLILFIYSFQKVRVLYAIEFLEGNTDSEKIAQIYKIFEVKNNCHIYFSLKQKDFLT